MWCIVHGDDFTFTGYDEDLDFIESIMQDAYEIKVRDRLGSGPNDVRSIDILGRLLEYESWGVSWKADPRHRKMIIDHFGFNEERKGVTVTGIREEPSEGGEILLNPVETTQFRAIAARFNYLEAPTCSLLPKKSVEKCQHRQ